jgi:hypothetical protein
MQEPAEVAYGFWSVRPEDRQPAPENYWRTFPAKRKLSMVLLGPI